MINKLLNALAEDNRFKIISMLKYNDYTVNELSDLLQLRQPQVSKHLKILHEAKIVTFTPIKQKRRYSLSIETFKEIEEWSIEIQETWNNRFDRLDEYIKEYKENKKNVKKNESNRIEKKYKGNNIKKNL